MSIKYSLVIQVDRFRTESNSRPLSDKLKAMIKVNKEKRFYQEAMLIAVNCLLPKQFYFIHEMVTFFFQMLKFFSAVNSWPITIHGFRD